MKDLMNLRIVTVIWLSILALTLGAVQAETQWTEDYEAAKKLAQTEKKDLLINVTGSDWCGWCIKLHKEVFGEAAFKEQAPKDFILVKLDFPRNIEQTDELRKQNAALMEIFKATYGFRGYPTIYLAGPDGVPYAATGYRDGGADAYLKHLAFLREAKPLVDPGATWIEDMDIAQAKAQALKKDLLIDFSGSDWCGWCIKLDKEVFDQETFKQQAPKDFILVKLDYPQRTPQSPKIKAQNEKLAQEFSAKYNFQGYPSVYLATPNGQPYAQNGYQAGGPEKYLQMLKEMKKQRPVDKK
jgi:thioredoxin-related protein